MCNDKYYDFLGNEVDLEQLQKDLEYPSIQALLHNEFYYIQVEANLNDIGDIEEYIIPSVDYPYYLMRRGYYAF